MMYVNLSKKAKLIAIENYINEFCPYEDMNTVSLKDIEYSIKENKIQFDSKGNIIDD